MTAVENAIAEIERLASERECRRTVGEPR